MSAVWFRNAQILHLLLLGAIVALYALLVGMLSATHPTRWLLTIGVAVMGALWSCWIFVEELRGGEPGSARKRALAAYRRLLNQTAPLLLSTAAFAVAAIAMSYEIFLHRDVSCFNPRGDDVTVYLSDPGWDESELATIHPGGRTAVRLRIGRSQIFFSPSGSVIRPFDPKSVDVPAWPAPAPTVTVAKDPFYDR